jgi:hypothetical protein
VKIYKRVQRDVDIVDVEICDWCGKHVEDEAPFEANDFNLEWKTGNIYPDGGYGETKEVDLCFKCREKFFKLLEENGIKINIKEWDY